jgi:2-polyprenyl-3-methyl-5-hydroxy-6-metoxy-1,4-benzoquinol methylase
MNLEAVPRCPICGSDGRHVIPDTRDYLLDVPGKWSYRRCEGCASLWLDPAPVASDVPALYPDSYYTHTDVDPLAVPNPTWMGRLLFACKMGAVAQRYGYLMLRTAAPGGLGFHVGRLAGYLPAIARKAGFFIRFLSSRAGGNLLDVGASNGAFLRLMQRLGWNVTGIEPDQRAATLAQAHGLNVIASPVEEAALRPAAYDAITLSHVIEHFKDPARVLAQLAAALRPGGVLVSISPNPEGWNARRFGGHWRGLEAPRHIVLPSLAGYAHMLAAAGLHGRPWTTTRWFYPSYRHSISIQRTGNAYRYTNRLRPALVTWLVRLLSWFRGNLGEEIVCVATKTPVSALPVVADVCHRTA